MHPAPLLPPQYSKVVNTSSPQAPSPPYLHGDRPNLPPLRSLFDRDSLEGQHGGPSSPPETPVRGSQASSPAGQRYEQQQYPSHPDIRPQRADPPPRIDSTATYYRMEQPEFRRRSSVYPGAPVGQPERFHPSMSAGPPTNFGPSMPRASSSRRESMLQSPLSVHPQSHYYQYPQGPGPGPWVAPEAYHRSSIPHQPREEYYDYRRPSYAYPPQAQTPPHYQPYPPPQDPRASQQQVYHYSFHHGDGGYPGYPVRKRRGNLPKDATAILKQWYDEHRASPYPTEDQKQMLVHQTQLTLNQVSNWFINARRRTPGKERQERAQNGDNSADNSGDNSGQNGDDNGGENGSENTGQI
ncbi:homeodomain super [Coniosporium tulheliwenetii]|uniref:Homeodomain super n=1 Tax=Coniosporium tulheliwenetii TaxID=3383036 RepID=A0ACC2ZDZ9_9PEZI|nr:homeodomain super [Cladosporium sp. JES 115]